MASTRDVSIFFCFSLIALKIIASSRLLIPGNMHKVTNLLLPRHRAKAMLAIYLGERSPPRNVFAVYVLNIVIVFDN